MEMKWAVTMCVALMRDGASGLGDIDDGEAVVRYVDGQVYTMAAKWKWWVGS